MLEHLDELTKAALPALVKKRFGVLGELGTGALIDGLLPASANMATAAIVEEALALGLLPFAATAGGVLATGLMVFGAGSLAGAATKAYLHQVMEHPEELRMPGRIPGDNILLSK